MASLGSEYGSRAADSANALVLAELAELAAPQRWTRVALAETPNPAMTVTPPPTFTRSPTPSLTIAPASTTTAAPVQSTSSAADITTDTPPEATAMGSASRDPVIASSTVVTQSQENGAYASVMIALIIVGSAVIVALVAVAFFMESKRRRARKTADLDEYFYDEGEDRFVTFGDHNAHRSQQLRWRDEHDDDVRMGAFL